MIKLKGEKRSKNFDKKSHFIPYCTIQINKLSKYFYLNIIKSILFDI